MNLGLLRCVKFLRTKVFANRSFGFKAFVESVGSFRNEKFLRFSNSVELSEDEPKEFFQKKLLKVAIVGRPNAGKSTLINKILNLNLCGVSHKSHTTTALFKTAFTKNDTQIIFVDTPGLVTQKEFKRFQLPKDFFQVWSKSVMDTVDIVGVIHEVREPRDFLKFPISLTQKVNEIPETKPLFLIINKIDLIIDKEDLSKAIDLVKNFNKLNPSHGKKEPQIWRKFSKIFFTSALQNTGVNEVVDYLLEQAQPGNWIFDSGQIFNKPLNVLILELLRAQVLEVLPNEIPYQCQYEIEYLKENNLGEIICVSLVTCKQKKHVNLITSKKKFSLRLLSKQLESDLYKILGKVFKIRIVVRGPRT